ncbi:MAG: kelch repeat-containing protein [Byssovorax sp.]
MRLTRTLPSLLLLAFVLLFAVAPGCGAGPEPPAAEQLRRSFPAQAAAVLDRREAFAPAAAGFVSRGAEGEAVAAAGLRAALPLSAGEAITLQVPAHDFEIRVRELDAAGESALAGGAVSYARSNGSSFWAATSVGAEEWLLLDAGVARAGHVVASWDVDGGALRQEGDTVVIDDAAGAPRVRVTAPAAFADGGRRVTATLAIRGATIDLTVDADDEAVLVDPLWVAAGSLKVARYQHSATVLPSGKVLVVGGYGGAPAAPLASAEVYDPATDAWTLLVPSLITARNDHRAILLGNGKVLIVGGSGLAGTLASAELYDPVANSFSPAGAMTLARSAPQLSLVGPGNAKVLVTGGVFNGLPTNLAELYDPVANTWAAAAPMLVAHSTHTSTLLSTNEVLVVGGRSNANISVSTAELYNAGTNTWIATAPLPSPRAEHLATVLLGGNVGVTGGINWFTPSSGQGVQSIVVYDPIAKTWTQGGGTGYHDYATATLVASGGLMLAGGNVSPTLVDFLDPLGVAWTNAGPLLGAGRAYHTASLLANGKVLLAGGYSGSTNTILQTAELYSPYATSTVCTVPGECQTGFCVDGFCCNTACTGLCQACSAAKKGSGASGTCGSIAVATDPDNECATQATSTCGTNGSCNGAGACQQYASGTSCLAASCSGSTLTNASTCNGTGTCVAGSQVSCGAYQCSGAACGTTCVLPTDCTAGNVCIAGKCVAPLPVGSVCTTANQCSSGFCADGFCCGTACGGLCQACSAAKTGGANGTCGSVIAATDPDNECAAQATSTCGTNGSCDGVGACQKYVTGTSCVAPSCSGSTLNNGSDCNGSGTCISKGTTPCDPYVCGVGAACKTLCVSNADCTAGNLCIGGKCGSPLPDGSICLSAGSCQSGNCVDGVCCNTACNGGACDACSKLAGAPSDGVCAMLTGNKCNDGDPCTQTDTCMAGTCMGLAVTCAALDACHTAGTCDATTGACTNPVASDGTTCNDGDGCTQADTCMLGTCVGGSPVVCVAQDSCHGVGVCNPKLGACDNPTLADDTPCDDGNKCTQSDKCTAGICASATPTDCPAIDACHLPGTCDLATGMCPNAETQTAKDCTIVGECDTGGACDPASGACTKTAKPDGSPCTNGVCLAGTCDGAGTGSASTGSASTGSTGSASTGSASTGSASTGSASTGSNGTGAGGSTGSEPSGVTGSGGHAGDGSVSPAGGCGCTTASTSESRAPWLLLGLVLVASRRRQRRLTA